MIKLALLIPAAIAATLVALYVMLAVRGIDPQLCAIC
jgi:hypothetical protein